MKTLCAIFVLLTIIASPVFAQNKEQDRVANAGQVMQEILNIPDDIPQSVIDKADCVVVLPSVLKFAFGFGGSYGSGVMTCRSGEDFKGPWGAPTMIALEGGSFGLQIGGQSTDFVFLLMTSRSARSILSSKVKLGGDISAAAGPVGRNLWAETDVAMQAEILSYLPGAWTFCRNLSSGSTLRPDNGANQKLYGKNVSAHDIVFNNEVTAPKSAKLLLSELNKKSPRISQIAREGWIYAEQLTFNTDFAVDRADGASGAQSAALAQATAAPTPEELDQLLAPVALYPDALLSQITTAINESTGNPGCQRLVASESRFDGNRTHRCGRGTRIRSRFHCVGEFSIRPGHDGRSHR